MKRKTKITITLITVVTALAVGGCNEFLNVLGYTTIKTYDLPHSSARMSIVTDGFQDRSSSVYLKRRFRMPKYLFWFDPYAGGTYSFDASSDGKLIRFQQSNTTCFVQSTDGSIVTAEATGEQKFQSLVPATTKAEVDGKYLWWIESTAYRK